MRHKNILKKAKFIDEFVNHYNKIRKRSSFPHKEVKSIIHFLFQGSSYSGKGKYKSVHRVSSRAKDFVLKTSHTKNIKNDVRAYNKLPENICNRYFAKIYWITKYCLLQRFGKSAKIPQQVLKKLKSIAKDHGLTDVRQENVRKFGRTFKIIDASLSKRKRLLHN